MGRFSSVLLLTLAACGDNLVDDPVDPQNDLELVDGSETLDQARVVPAVCGVQTWSTNIAGTNGMNVSVVPRSEQAVAIATPVGGGVMTGFLLDPGLHAMSSNKLPIDGTFSQVVASIVSDRLVSTAIENGDVYVHMLDDDFTNPQYIAKLPATMIAEPAFYNVQADLVMPAVGNDGLWLYRFQDSLEPIDARHIMTTAPARSMTAAQMGVAMLTAWSTDDDCYMMLTSTFSGGLDAHLPIACNNPRLAVNARSGDGAMVFDSDDGVHIMPVRGTQFSGATKLMRPGTHSPRAVFDGRHVWVSFLDIRGDVIVGYIDANQKFVSMSLSGPKPDMGAYELVMVDNTPWVFSLDQDGYAGYRMCLDTVQ